MTPFIKTTLLAFMTALSINPSFGMECPESDCDNPFNSVPVEITTMVLNYVEEKELATLSQVNHEFHDLSDADEFWETLFHKNADIAVALRHHDPMNQSLSRYITYRDTVANYPRLAELDPLHTTLAKPKDISWKEHYKAVFGAPNSTTLIVIEQQDDAKTPKKKKVKKKCLVS